MDPLVTQSEQQPSSEKTGSKSFSTQSKKYLYVIIIELFIFFLVAGIGYYIYSSQKKLQSPQQVVIKQIATTPAPSQKSDTIFGPTSKIEPTPIIYKIHEQFTNTVDNNCKPYFFGEGSSTTIIDKNLLPVQIDPLLKTNIWGQNQQVPENNLYCESDPERKYTPNLFLKTSDDQLLRIYTLNPFELGHGGHSLFGSFEKIIKNDEDTIFSWSFNFADVGPPIIENQSINIRGEKKITEPDGQTIIVLTDINNVINTADAEFLEILKKYSEKTTWDIDPRDSQIYEILNISDSLYQEIKQKYYPDEEKIDPRIQEAISSIETNLNLIKLK